MPEITCTITGAAGRIAYAFIPLICSGAVFGPETEVHLKLLDIEMAAERLRGKCAHVLQYEPTKNHTWLGDAFSRWVEAT